MRPPTPRAGLFFGLVLCACQGSAPAGDERPAASGLGRFGLRADAERAPVPVLLPPPDGLIEPWLLVEPGFYAFSARLEGGAWMAIHADRQAKAYPELQAPEPAQRIRGGWGRVGENEHIWTAAFVEGGAAYAVDVGCTRLSDLRCASEDYALALANGLTAAGPP